MTLDRLTTTFVLALACAGAAACDRSASRPDGGITDEQFVDAVVELRRAGAEVKSAAEFAPRKAEILRRHRVTEKELQDFARTRSRDLDAMSVVWDSVEARLARAAAARDSARAAEATRRDSAGAAETPR
jgi:hypothetical protein